MTFPWIVFGIVLALGIVILWANYYRETKRTQALKAVARSLGLTFTVEGTSEIIDSLPTFHWPWLHISGTPGQEVRNVLENAAAEPRVTIFDYSYWYSFSIDELCAVDDEQTVMVFRSSTLGLPTFALRPGPRGVKIGSHLAGIQYIDFRSHAAFSKQYLLLGMAEEAVRGIFTESVLSFYSRRRGITTEGCGDTLTFYRKDKRVRPNDLRAFMKEGFEVYEIFKSASSGN